MDAFAWVCLGWALFASFVALVGLGSALGKDKDLKEANRHGAAVETDIRLLKDRFGRLEKAVGGLLVAADDDEAS